MQSPSPSIREATAADIPALAALAGRTFPLACPPELGERHVAAFIAEHLSEERFAAHLVAGHRVYLTGGGYALVLHGVHAAEGPSGWRAQRSAYLSKLYVDPDRHGGGEAQALMTAAVDGARADGCVGLWLGVNRQNTRAKRFYAKSGLTVAGERAFTVGESTFIDDVLVLPLT